MEVQKVLRIGDSFTISIPADWVREMNLEDRPVQIIQSGNGDIIIRPMKETCEFEKTVENFVVEYNDVFESLAKR